MADDDERWLDGLAGRAAEGADAVREGTMLRAAMRRWPPVAAPVPERDAAHLAGTIARARAAGLFASRTPSPRARWYALRPVRWVAAFATVAVVATLVVLRPGPVDETTVRSAPDAVVLLRVADPDAERRRLVEALASRGVKASTYARFGRLGVDADLPSPLPDDLKALLARDRIPVPADGVLRVEFEAAR